ncbi:carboxymuconolactone decarboxylase family protein [Exilibacterium tricleocarpae]|uniref:Carboxymuconolactone decarboxylase family protein n=1 Tax=Exilibacterium tricleocarpae TaxID=2591008 RepID=A0A545T0J7_9GAMM|nr:carboxymuconolactone decarboxylase family protein [Exilibacterium tricleocarpae]TQV70744.1 carboxymuconolactone decarboxylase family protein [Exilibacterium tricleocarpae]
MSDTTAVKYEQVVPDVLQSLAGIHDTMDTHGFDRTIHHLVQLRASQINRCGFCIKMHIREARRDGETDERLDRVIVWDQVGDFTEPEQAALAWTEALTSLDAGVDLGALRARLRNHFSEPEIGILTATVAMINLWNRINISRH